MSNQITDNSPAKSPYKRSGFHKTIHQLQRIPSPDKDSIITESKDNFPFKAGSSYQGMWENTLKHGFGTQSLIDGTKYEGMWQNDKKHGEGVLWKRSEKKFIKKYEGEWALNMKEGNGIFYYSDGSIYKGEWKQDKKHGKGHLVNSQGDVYEGMWKEGKLTGESYVQFKNGNVFIGNYLEGLKSGKGRYFYANSRKVYSGEWLEDQPVCGELRDPSSTELTYFPTVKSGTGEGQYANDSSTYDYSQSSHPHSPVSQSAQHHTEFEPLTPSSSSSTQTSNFAFPELMLSAPDEVLKSAQREAQAQAMVKQTAPSKLQTSIKVQHKEVPEHVRLA